MMKKTPPGGAPDAKEEEKEKRHESVHFQDVYKRQVFDYKIVGRNRELFWVFLVMMVYFIGFNVYFPYITVYFTDNLGMDYTLTGDVYKRQMRCSSVPERI